MNVNNSIVNRIVLFFPIHHKNSKKRRKCIESNSIDSIVKTFSSPFLLTAFPSGENVELSQHQSKLIDTHQKQMQLMKTELDEGYKNVLNDYQREQSRLQARYEQCKQQLTDAQLLIEQLKSTINQTTKIQEEFDQKKHSFEHDYRTRHEHLQQRSEKLVKLLEQSNET